MTILKKLPRFRPRRLLMTILGVFILVYVFDNFYLRSTKRLLPQLLDDISELRINVRLSSSEKTLMIRSPNYVNNNTTHFTAYRNPKEDSSKISEDIIYTAEGFQTVVPDQVWVYSAYIDYRVASPVLRVFGLISRVAARGAKFQVLYFSDEFTDARMANCLGTSFTNSVMNIDNFHPNTRDWALALQTKVPITVKPWFVKSVAITLYSHYSNRTNSSIVNLLRVTHVKDIGNRSKTDFTICTSPIFFGYSDIGEFLQMVEIGHMFGVQKFVIYDLDIGEKLVPYVEYYKKQGLVDVLPWNIPRYDRKNKKSIHKYIHYFGQVISINDCIYRYMYKTSFVAVLDLDEVIMPLKTSNWSQMLTSLKKSSHTYDFRCVFFKKEWPNEEHYPNLTQKDVELIKDLGLDALMKTKRENRILPHKLRSKEMVRPEVVQFYHIHFVDRYMNAGKSEVVNVDEKDALLFHYRWWNTTETNWLVDRRMFRYSKDIMNRMRKVVNTVQADSKV